MDQRSSALMLMYNTVPNKIEFTFKIETPCSCICTEVTAGISIMKDIVHLCMTKKV